MILMSFLLTSAVLFIGLFISLSDINPYRPEEVPMLDQIEAFMSSCESPTTGSWSTLDLAA